MSSQRQDEDVPILLRVVHAAGSRAVRQNRVFARRERQTARPVVRAGALSFEHVDAAQRTGLERQRLELFLVHRQTVEKQHAIRLVPSIVDAEAVERDAGLRQTGDLVVRQAAQRKEPFLPVDRLQEDGLLLLLPGHAEQHVHVDARRRGVRHPRPIVAVDPAADHVEIRRNGNRLRRTDEYFRNAFSVIAIRQFADVFSEQLLFARPLESRDGIFRLDRPTVQIFEIDQRGPVVLRPPRPVHFVWTHADLFLLSERGKAYCQTHDEHQQSRMSHTASLGDDFSISILLSFHKTPRGGISPPARTIFS